ncbi:hypothetical protein BJX65DRAFT_247550 [Aspergillus insuetus]
MAHTIEAAMTEALTHLSRVAEHFRSHEQPRAANGIGKASAKLVEAFNEGIAGLSPSEYVFDFMPDSRHHAAAHPADPQAILQRQAHEALMNEVEKGKRGDANAELSRIQQTIGPAPLHPSSWVQVASSVSSAQGTSTRSAQFFKSPTSLASSSPSMENISSDDEEKSGKELAPFPAPTVPEIPEKAGIIRVYGRVTRDVVNFITTRIREGPLHDIRVETNGRSRVIFQHASNALAFFKSNQEMVALLGYGRFGPGYSVELAEIVDWNDDLHRMNQPIRERRRLSFARKRLFADNMSPEKWKHDIRAIAGAGNIDFLWVFNSGNATAVFTSTGVARKVLEVFNRWKDGRNVYSGVSVTYSSDPCEKELTLVKEANRPNNGKYLVRKPFGSRN